MSSLIDRQYPVKVKTCLFASPLNQLKVNLQISCILVSFHPNANPNIFSGWDHNSQITTSLDLKRKNSFAVFMATLLNNTNTGCMLEKLL